MEYKPDEDVTCLNFYDHYSSYLTSEDELETPNFDGIDSFPTRKEYGESFNERLSDYLDVM
jgi:hypothetical protein